MNNSMGYWLSLDDYEFKTVGNSGMDFNINDYVGHGWFLVDWTTSKYIYYLLARRRREKNDKIEG